VQWWKGDRMVARSVVSARARARQAQAAARAVREKRDAEAKVASERYWAAVADREEAQASLDAATRARDEALVDLGRVAASEDELAAWCGMPLDEARRALRSARDGVRSRRTPDETIPPEPGPSDVSADQPGLV